MIDLPLMFVIADVAVVVAAYYNLISRTELVKTCKALDVGYSTVWSELSTTLVMAKLAVTAKVDITHHKLSEREPGFRAERLSRIRF